MREKDVVNDLTVSKITAELSLQKTGDAAGRPH